MDDPAAKRKVKYIRHSMFRRNGYSHLADIVEVPVGGSLLSKELLVSIEHDMQLELMIQ